MPPREARLYRFVARMGEESAVRAALGRLPQRVGEGERAVRVAAYFRGSAVFLLLEGSGDLFAALAGDAASKRLLAALGEHADYDPARVDEAEIPRRPLPGPAREVSA